MKMIDWEAALRAWRVVQPGIFRSIYKTPDDFPRNKYLRKLLRLPGLRLFHERWPMMYRLRREVEEEVERYDIAKPSEFYPWFNLPTITRTTGIPFLRSNESGLYHAGSYLRHMLSALTFLQVLLLFPMAIQVGNALGGAKDLKSAKDILAEEWVPFWVRLLVLGASLATIMVSKMNAGIRREMIEGGLLSIHSCAIIWQAVVLAHFRSIELTPGYAHYTEKLVAEATEIASKPFAIHNYIRYGTVAAQEPPHNPYDAPVVKA